MPSIKARIQVLAIDVKHWFRQVRDSAARHRAPAAARPPVPRRPFRIIPPPRGKDVTHPYGYHDFRALNEQYRSAWFAVVVMEDLTEYYHPLLLPVAIAGRRPYEFPAPLKLDIFTEPVSRVYVVVPSDVVSRIHLAFVILPTGCFVLDLGSTNGTSINAVPLTGGRFVKDRDVIHFGGEEYPYVRIEFGWDPSRWY